MINTLTTKIHGRLRLFGSRISSISSSVSSSSFGIVSFGSTAVSSSYLISSGWPKDKK